MLLSFFWYGIFKVEFLIFFKEVKIECVIGYLFYVVIGWVFKLYLLLLLCWFDNFEVYVLVFIYIDNEYLEIVWFYKYCGMRCYDFVFFVIN